MMPRNEDVVTLLKKFNLCIIMYTVKCKKIKF
jgi:hypothetical protein